MVEGRLVYGIAVEGAFFAIAPVDEIADRSEEPAAFPAKTPPK
jgi:hypothetical protein